MNKIINVEETFNYLSELENSILALRSISITKNNYKKIFLEKEVSVNKIDYYKNMYLLTKALLHSNDDISIEKYLSIVALLSSFESLYSYLNIERLINDFSNYKIVKATTESEYQKYIEKRYNIPCINAWLNVDYDEDNVKKLIKR